MTAEPTTGTPPTARTVRRRTLVKGSAWAVPVISVASAAPALAQSIPPRGLNGWVSLSRSCGWWTDNVITINGLGDYPDRGIWVFINDQNATIQDASMTFYFQNSSLTWTNQSQSGWSNLTRDLSRDGLIPGLSGYYAYTTSYSGAWSFNETAEAWIANSDPYFTATYSSNCQSVSSYSYRRVTTNGETIAFHRGPITV